MDDLISRQAAINALHNEIVRRRINDDGVIDEFDTEAILKQLTSTQSDRKKGKWELFIQCTACGYKRKWNGEIFGFCPNCGADMREEENDVGSEV